MIHSIYETKRLKLRLSCPELAPSVSHYFIRNKAFLQATETIHKDIFYTTATQRTSLEIDQQHFKKGTAVKFWLSPKKDDRIIGMFAFNNIVMHTFQSCFLSYRLDQDFVDQGLMTEALKLGIDLAFNTLLLHRIEANIMPKNKPSLRVVEKLNFQNEGTSPQYLKINGQWEDHIHMVLLNHLL